MLVIGCVALRCHVEILCYTALEALVNDSQLNLIFYVIYPSSAYLSFALSIRPKSGPEPLMDCRTLALRNEHRRPRSATKMLRAISAHGTKPSSPHRLIAHILAAQEVRIFMTLRSSYHHSDYPGPLHFDKEHVSGYVARILRALDWRTQLLCWCPKIHAQTCSLLSHPPYLDLSNMLQTTAFNVSTFVKYSFVEGAVLIISQLCISSNPVEPQDD